MIVSWCDDAPLRKHAEVVVPRWVRDRRRRSPKSPEGQVGLEEPCCVVVVVVVGRAPPDATNEVPWVVRYISPGTSMWVGL